VPFSAVVLDTRAVQSGPRVGAECRFAQRDRNERRPGHSRQSWGL